MGEIIVLRLGHRIERDKRITTHCCLVARAFGAEEIIISGQEDEALIKRINKLSKEWGNGFKASFKTDGLKIVKKAKENNFKIIHLTMYGLPIEKKIKKLKKLKKLLIVVGGQKVGKEFYELADYNIGVSNQPHSEVSALAVFLHELFEGKELERIFLNAKKKILPAKKGKILKQL